MQRFFIILVIFTLSIPGIILASNSVDAADIIQQINAGRDVFFENTVIRGNLDFTSIKEITIEKQKGNQTTYLCHVRGEVKFVNCQFKDDVIAYRSEKFPNELYIPVFYEDVLFSGCEINGDFAFKYVRFKANANFDQTIFKGETNFKYTKFTNKADFSHTRFAEEAEFKYTTFPEFANFEAAHFENDANFKYTKFSQKVNFKLAVFADDANFKYTKFPEGVSFENAIFEKSVDFKYTKFSEPVNFTDAQFDGDVDCKYTTVDGKSFSLHLLKSKK